MADLWQVFRDTFNTNGTPCAFFAPGRINLIGEHTDYNGGHVFPAAISFGTYALGRKRNDTKCRFYSMNFPEAGVIVCDLSDAGDKLQHEWVNYPKGMIAYMMGQGHTIEHGADILFYGNIPNGAGLSSSASIEIATGVLLEHLFNLDIDRIDIIKLAQRVENNHIGVNSGIMDQFVIGMGRNNHAILLDCQTLDYTYAPIELQDHAMLIMNTNKQRTLADSAYNERRQQCKQALADLQTTLAIKSLGDLTIEQFEQYQHLIQNDINRKRARHAISENIRTLQSLNKLQNGDLEAFGQLMNASHKSLQQDYEVTGRELDTIVEAAWKQEGVLGARMTGAGFGGCAIAIVQRDKIDTFKTNVTDIYTKTFGYEPTFYTASIVGGAQKIAKGAF